MKSRQVSNRQRYTAKILNTPAQSPLVTVPEEGNLKKAVGKKGQKTLCLNMIVKNEEGRIIRALESVREWIDYWIISDTGSTDKTISLIKLFFAKHGIPGELHEQPWKNFGHNRTESLKLAKGKADYILLMDADMCLKVKDPDFKNKINGDVFSIPQISVSSDPHVTPKRYYFRRLLNGTHNYYYIGRTHECLESTHPNHKISNFDLIEYDDFEDGSNRPEKYARDIPMLEMDLQDDPNSTRFMTYLAQSYFGQAEFLKSQSNSLKQTAKDTKVSDLEKEGEKKWVEAKEFFMKAINMYRRRVKAAGWYTEEIWYSRHNMAKCYQSMGAPWEQVEAVLLECFFTYPRRAEPIYDIIYHYRQTQEFEKMYKYARMAVATPFPTGDVLPVYTELYNYLLMDELAIASFGTKRYTEAFVLWSKILSENKVTQPVHRGRIQGNLNYCKKVMQEDENNKISETLITNKNINKKILCFYIGYATNIEPNKNEKESKAYGSELALLKLSASLQSHYKIYVFGPSIGQNSTDSGITFMNSAYYKEFQKNNVIDVLIISRYVHYFVEFELTAKQTYIWVHDVSLQPFWNFKVLTNGAKHLLRNVMHKINGIITLCEWHRKYFIDNYGVPSEKVSIIGNAIDTEQFLNKNIVREKNRFIWTSSPDRGLDKMVEYFHEIRKKLPNATLHVYRGLDGVDPKLIEEVKKYSYIQLHGRVPNHVLVNEFLRSEFWLYPTNFCETYCISALEAQMAGCICICTDLAALTYTVADRGILLKQKPYTVEYREELISEVLMVASDDHIKTSLREKAMTWAREQTWKNRGKEWMKLFDANAIDLKIPTKKEVAEILSKAEEVVNKADLPD